VETEETGQTTREDLYAAGDNVRGADLVVTAVAAARKAAVSMHHKLIQMREKKGRITNGKQELTPSAPAQL
jgi:NADPH-dependent glutamate synthase beta subunit-like oxidoreductase